jgi:hypothetical protein
MVSCTPLSAQSELKAVWNSSGMGSSVPMSGAELTISEYRCRLLTLFPDEQWWRTYNVVVIFKVYVVFLHGGVDGLEGRDQVVEDGGPPCLALEALEAARVDDAHLLEDRRLATFTGTCTLVSVTIYHRSPS